MGVKMAAYLHRYIEKPVIDDLARKMVFIGGPRQAGKTTLAKHLCKSAGYDIKQRYLNWNATEDRENIIMELILQLCSIQHAGQRIKPYTIRYDGNFISKYFRKYKNGQI
jgi:predicted AAA+ superfamily ATPase